MRYRLLSLLAAMLLLMAAACGEDGGETVAEEETTPAEETPAAEEETPTAEEEMPTAEAETPMVEEGDGVVVAVGSSDLGDILVDGEGRTLYVFLNDEQGESVCYDECEGNWPPLVGEPEAGEGVDASLLGTGEREDGSSQATYNDWPLYHYAADSASGDTNGQGIGEVWFVVGPDGEPIQNNGEETARY